MSDEYEQSSFKNTEPLNKPQIQNNDFLVSGFNDSDKISAVYGDHIPNWRCIADAVGEKSCAYLERKCLSHASVSWLV